MKRILASELEGGDDHEFLVRLYTHVLDRWPDRDGYSHYLTRIEGKPEARTAVIRDVARSEEARKLEVTVVFPEEPSGPAVEAAPATALPNPPPPVQVPPAGPGRAAPAGAPPFASLPPSAHGGPIAVLAGEVATLRAQLARLEAEIATLRSAPVPAKPAIAEAPPSATLLEDVSQQIDALFALGLAGIEARLVALERGQTGG